MRTMDNENHNRTLLQHSIFLPSPPPPVLSEEFHSQSSSSSPEEELQFKLLCASLELEKVKAEEKLQETKLWHLQELLHIIRKERDDAREECRKLQECLLHKLPSNPLPVHSPPNNFLCSASSSQSPPWNGLHDLDDHILLTHHAFSPSPPTHQPSIPSEHPPPFPSFSQSSCHGGEAELDALLLSCTSVDQQEALDLQILAIDQDLRFDAEISDLRPNGGGHGEVLDAIAVSVPQSPPPPSTVRGASPDSTFSPSKRKMLERCESELTEEASAAKTIVEPARRRPADNEPASSDAEDYHEVAFGVAAQPAASMEVDQSSERMVQQQTVQMISETESYQRGIMSLPLQKVHLPEPPEADPRVMLSSLPEKGKLLQAVMRAGPLLHELLVAGPMPLWRNPPPQALGDSTSCIPAAPMAFPTAFADRLATDSCGFSSRFQRRATNDDICGRESAGRSDSWSSSRRTTTTNVDMCGRSRRLFRKLAPSPSPSSSLPTQEETDPLMMHMLPGTGISYPPTIY